MIADEGAKEGRPAGPRTPGYIWTTRERQRSPEELKFKKKKKSTHHTPLLPFSVPSRQRSFPCSPAQVHSASYENDSCFGGAGRVRCNGSEKRRRVKRKRQKPENKNKCGGTGGPDVGILRSVRFTFF